LSRTIAAASGTVESNTPTQSTLRAATIVWFPAMLLGFLASLSPASSIAAPNAVREVAPVEAAGADAAREQSRREDERLVARCQAGEREAFDELVARHQDRIYNLCFWMLHDRDEAADAAQDAFVRAFRALPNFRGESAFSTWLHRIAVNVSLDASARRKKAPQSLSSVGSDDDDKPALDPADSSPGPAEIAARRERRQLVRAALAELQEHHRVVLVLFDIEGRTYEEAAERLELPMGTIKSRLNRARAALRVALEAHRELFLD